jgi:glycosyltransferase involved in cell wall biosynthesis
MISIVTGTLNRRAFLPQLIENCLSSPLTELVLLDGGSSDGTQDYIKGLKHPRIKLIEIGKRSSWSSFMNVGIKAASHELVCQWNDDVLLLATWEEVVKEIEPKYDIYVFSWKTGTMAQSSDPTWLKTGEFNGLSANPALLRKETYGTSSNGWRCHCFMNYGIYRKDVFRKAGLYCEDFLFYHADGDMTNRAYYLGFANRINFLPHIKVLDIDSPSRTKYGLDRTSQQKDLALFWSRLSSYENGKRTNIEVLP